MCEKRRAFKNPFLLSLYYSAEQSHSIIYYSHHNQTHISFEQLNRSHECIARMRLVRLQVIHTQNLGHSYHDVPIRHQVVHKTMGGAYSAGLAQFAIGPCTLGCVHWM